jgi:phosphoribosylformimino-5-aminoimidazole carboxamide ribotide isomerase
MTLFRPCIDLHEGYVKQIVGGTLTEAGAKENFVAEQPASYFASLYKKDGLKGGHVIQLGPGNQEAALAALGAYPGALQLGGGVTTENARFWIEAGASRVIVTSFLFEDGRLSESRLDALRDTLMPEELTIDLSCRKVGDGWNVATNRWQTVTETEVTAELFRRLSPYCSEFLVHAADVEGLCRGIDTALVRHLSEISQLPVTYAGGAKNLSDLDHVDELSDGRVDLTFGSDLDIFGGKQVKYTDCVAWNRGASRERVSVLSF